MLRVAGLAAVMLLASCGGNAATGPSDGGAGTAGTSGEVGTGGSGGSGTGGTSGGTGGMAAGGTGGGADDSGSTYNCRSACDNIASAACAPPDGGVSTCVSECALTVTSGCDAEWRDYLSCLSTATIACAATGRPETFRPCGSQSVAWSACSACTPQTSDTACATCVKSMCCAEEKAFLSHPDYVDWGNCLTACTVATCIQACNDQYASLLQTNAALWDCTEAACPACPPRPPM